MYPCRRYAAKKLKVFVAAQRLKLRDLVCRILTKRPAESLPENEPSVIFVGTSAHILNDTGYKTSTNSLNMEAEIDVESLFNNYDSLGCLSDISDTFNSDSDFESDIVSVKIVNADIHN